MDQPVSTLLDKRPGDIHTVDVGASAADAVRTMNQAHVGCVAVMDNGRLAGIFTERDVLRRVVESHRDPSQTPVADVMTSDVVVISPSDTLQHAMVLVNTRNCRHLPVMDGDTLVGMVSVRDLIGAVVDGQEHRIAELTDYIYGGYGLQARVDA
ncbi:CBS domain-containing protein [Aquisalimonas sp. APHAB1-3]|uniref:CBS domain-containing protein n=1 Tax=Aquisalimonas sp. APHAB1-3 TaxID=3402080 RepID=UPI003AAA2F1D